MHVLIIDWPQFVRRDHPNAEDLLRRDVKNVLDPFKRRFKVKVSLEDAVSFVSGKTEKLKI
jgi:RIO kinase 2